MTGTRMAWELSAEATGRVILTFESSAAFIAASDCLDQSTPVYVDYSLGAEQGDVVSRRLHSLGFRAVYLATGHDSDRIPHMPWISGTVGKKPPWFEMFGDQ